MSEIGINIYKRISLLTILIKKWSDLLQRDQENLNHRIFLKS